MTTQVETEEGWDGGQLITNKAEIIHALVTAFDGEKRPKVSDPTWHKPEGNPRLLRVGVPREGLNFKVANVAEEMGCYISDFWQKGHDHEAEVIQCKVKPRED